MRTLTSFMDPAELRKDPSKHQAVQKIHAGQGEWGACRRRMHHGSAQLQSIWRAGGVILTCFKRGSISGESFIHLKETTHTGLSNMTRATHAHPQECPEERNKAIHFLTLAASGLGPTNTCPFDKSRLIGHTGHPLTGAECLSHIA